MSLLDYFRGKPQSKTEFSPSPAAPQAATGSLEEFQSMLVKTAIERKPLLEKQITSADDLKSLRSLNQTLALLEMIKDDTPDRALPAALRTVLDAEAEDKSELLRDLREHEEEEARHFLRLVIEGSDPAPVRKSASSALLYNAGPAEREWLQQVFLRDHDPVVRESTIFSLDPAENRDHAKYLIENFKEFPPVLRRCTIDLLKEAADDPEVKKFLDKASNFSKEEQTYMQGG